LRDSDSARLIPVTQPLAVTERGCSKRLGKMTDEERRALAEALRDAQETLEQQQLPGEEYS